MRHTIGETKTSDGSTLFTDTWLPDSPPKGVLAFSHGAGEHCGRYQHVGAALAEAGYALYMADLRGYGRCQGKRGHIMAWDEYLCDMSAIMEGAQQLAPGGAHFFGGHSVGGLIAASKALGNPSDWRGVVLSGPFLQGAWKPTAWKLTMARLLSSVLPGFTTDSDFDPATVSRSPEVVAAYAADPLVTDKVSVRAATEILDAQVRTMRAASQLELPLLIMQAGEDKLSLPAASRRFYEAASSPDKTFKLYEGLYHEIFNEPEQDRVFADLIAWLDAHL